MAESFNARYLSFKEVADSFVRTKNFERLLSPCHTLLMGPRGCGKTTMLKMLHPQALSVIEDMANAPFWGVYVPSDRQWAMQLNSLDSIISDGGASQRLSKAVVNLNFLYSLCDTFSTLLQQANISEGEETFSFYQQLIEVWNIDKPIVPTMGAIKIKLKKYVAEISALFNNVSNNNELPFVGEAGLIELLTLGIEVFENAFDSNSLLGSRKRWAICIDELEITPDWFRDYIMTCMRSVDQRLFFKVTSIPVPSEQGDLTLKSSSSNDYEVIRTWIYNDASRDEWRNFCYNYLQAYLLEKEGLSYEDFMNSLIPADFDYNYQSKQELLNKSLHELVKVDDGFYHFLLRNDADPSADDILQSCKKTLRFTYGVIYSRLKSMQNVSNHHATSRYYPYINDWLLYEYSDGSPRVFINIVKGLRQLIVNSHNAGLKKIRLNDLSHLIVELSDNTLYNKFAYFPSLPIIYKEHFITYKEILDYIGNYLSERLNGPEYILLPETLFTYESKELSEFVKLALTSGAIIMIEDTTLYKGVRRGGKVFRLNYGLYPYYHYVKTTSRDVLLIEDIIDYMMTK